MITIPFAFWGIESYLGGGGKEYAAMIDDDEIPVYQFENAYSNQLARLNEQFDKNIPYSNAQIKAQVLEQLINAVVLEKNSYASGYRISDDNLKQSIATLFSREGKFDRDYFENIVASNGMTTTQYETRLRNELRVVQKQNAIVTTAFVTDEEARRLAALEQQQRKIRVIKYTIDTDAADIVVTDQEIEDYYNANIDRYMSPERVSVEYVEITAGDLEDSIDIDEAKLASMYDDYKRIALKNQERKARHILLQIGDAEENNRESVMARIKDLQQKLDDGASFDELAREYSEDTGSAVQGGDLGWVSAGEMVKPFEDVLFSMNKGEISDVVETRFGLHLIRLDDIRTPEVETFAEKRGDFEQELRQEVLGSMFYDISENMAISAYENPDSLEAVVDAVNKQPAKTEMFTRDSGSGIAENEKFRTAAFSSAVIEEGLNSDIIEIEPNHVAVLRLLKHEPASKRPLTEVRADIENVLRLKAAHSRSMAAAEDAKNRIVAGNTVESVLSSDNRTIEDIGAVKRREFNKADPMVVEAAFQMPYPEQNKPSVQVVNTMSGDVAVVLLDEVITPADIAKEEIDAVKRQRKNDVADSDFDFVLTTIKDATEIQRNNSLLQ
jgi:peptidyl-prolyl cis-trans isomerase D